jgi:hypothetical protein
MSLARTLAAILGLMIGVATYGSVVGARAPENPLPDRIAPGQQVGIRNVARIPAANPSGFAPIQYLHHAGDGSGRLFVADLRGQIWLIKNGRLARRPFHDLAAVLGDRLRAGCNSCGVRSFAFHPDFDRPGSAGFGKVYTLTIQVPSSSATRPGTPIFRWTRSPVDTVDVVSEWQIDPLDPDRIDPTSEREVMRIEQWKIGHSAEHIGFNPAVGPNDADYGKLYIGIGDGGFDETNPDPFRNAQDTLNVLGTLLRINPLTRGRPGYRIPRDNPFRSDPTALPEIWAYGFRNPQRFSWDTAGRGRLLIADIGQANVEEINLGLAGANYGWREREGTFVLDPADPNRVLERPPDDRRFGFTYPVLQYDHDLAGVPSGLTAITGGFVYRGDRIRRLIGHYLFADLVSGRIFHVPVADLRPGLQARFRELRLARRGRPFRLLDLDAAERVDLRFGQDEDGEIYLLTKQDGRIWKLVPDRSSNGMR